MRRGRRRGLCAVLAVICLAGACSWGGPTAGTDPPASIKDWEALWDAERAEVVRRIVDNGWGWDQGANKITGPGGFEVDLNACPVGWDPYGGLDGGVITLGQVLDQSGPSTEDGVSQGLYYDYVNRHGGISDSTGTTYTIVNDIRDDDAHVGQTQPIVDQLLAAGTFTIQTAGSATTAHVYDKIHASCVPDPVVLSGLPAWNDPENNPWVWGQQLAHNTEAMLWGTLIETKFGERGDVSVGALVMQNSVGIAYEAAFAEFIERSPVPVNVTVEYIEPTALQRTVNERMSTLASRDLDVFIAMVAGRMCTHVITEAASNGLKESADLLLQPSVCEADTYVGNEAVGGDGSAANGWWIAGGGVKDLTDPALADDAWVTFARNLLAEGGHPLSDTSSVGTALPYAWLMVEALRIAAELPGGVSRPNLLIAARTMATTNPTMLNGIAYNMSGNDDAYLAEASEFAVYDSSSQRWITQADLGVIDLEGTTPNCSWDRATGTCIEDN